MMTRDELRALQAPVKTRFQEHPEAALATLRATGRLEGAGITVTLDTFSGVTPAGLHPACGGDGLSACSAEMLLQALAGCAGVTLKAVATAMEIPLRGGSVTVEGDLDFRGTMGVSKQAPVGFTAIRLLFDLDADANADQLANLTRLVERYCVVHQTLSHPPTLTTIIRTHL